MIQKLTFRRVWLVLPALVSFSCQNGSDVATNPQTPSAKLPVDIVVATQEALSQEEIISGTINPLQEVSIVSETSQKIVKIAFSDGQMVTKGQLLYKLNDAELKANLKELRADLKLAMTSLNRYKNLLATETIRQQEYDEAATKYESLAAKEEALQFELSKTEIRAPFSGRIGISKFDLGAYVSPGQDLVTLQDQSKITLEFSVPERYVLMTGKNAKVYFTTALSSQRHEAVIKAVEAAVDSGNRSLTVHAVATNPKNELKGGMSAKIFFSVVEKDSKGISIPSQALIPGENGYSVYLNKDGIAMSVPVKLGNRNETSATIISGINQGDHVIISNILRLMDGTPVEEVANNLNKS